MCTNWERGELRRRDRQKRAIRAVAERNPADSFVPAPDELASLDETKSRTRKIYRAWLRESRPDRTSRRIVRMTRLYGRAAAVRALMLESDCSRSRAYYEVARVLDCLRGHFRREAGKLVEVPHARKNRKSMDDSAARDS